MGGFKLAKKQNNIKSIGSILGWIFGILFLLTGIVLFSSSFISALGFLIMGLVLLPPIAQFSKDNFNFEISMKLKILLLCFGFFVIIAGSSNINNAAKDMASGDKGQQTEKLNLKGMSAEQVFDKYISYFDYDDVDDRLNKLYLEKQIAEGAALESLKNTEYYIEGINSIYSKWISDCSESETYFGYDVCGNLSLNMKSWKATQRKFETTSKEIIEETLDTTTIKTTFKSTIKTGSDVDETMGEYTYVLKQNKGIWKVTDFIDESGNLFSETTDLKQIRKTDEETIQNLTALFSDFKKVFDELVNNEKRRMEYTNEITKVIYSVIPSERVIEINIDNYDNNLEKHLITITYYFEKKLLVDEYLQILHDSSNLFEEVFPVNSKIYQIQITVKEKYKDDYGNTQERYLARTSMNRETYAKINWEGFEKSKLDNIAEVSYYGDSFYKSLRDIQDSSKQWQESSSASLPIVGGMPSNMCEIFKEECIEYGDCIDYDELKSMGMCN